MSEQVFSDIWYASDSHLNERGSAQSGTVYEDQGFLAATAEALEFRGVNGIVPIPDVERVELEQRSLATVTRISLFAAGGMFVVCGVCGGVGLPVTLLLDPLVGEVGLFVVLLMVFGLASIVVGVFIVWLGRNATPWVKVTYAGGQEVYFADGRMFGWRGIGGGTKQLYTHIIDMVSENRASDL